MFESILPTSARKRVWVVWPLLIAFSLLVLLAESCDVISPCGRDLVPVHRFPRHWQRHLLRNRGGGDEDMEDGASGVESGRYVPGTIQNEPSLDSVMTADVSRAGSLTPRTPGPGILCDCKPPKCSWHSCLFTCAVYNEKT